MKTIVQEINVRIVGESYETRCERPFREKAGNDKNCKGAFFAVERKNKIWNDSYKIKFEKH